MSKTPLRTDRPLPKKLILEEVAVESNGRFSSPQGDPSEKRLRAVDPETGHAWGFIVIDNTKRGPGLGGIRIAPDLNLNEVGRLARAMTLKNSAAMIPYGGGKAGLIHDPVSLQKNPALKQELIHLFAECLFEIEGYISAPDMGTNETDTQHIYEYFSERLGTFEHKRGGSSRPFDKGGIPIDDWGLTAHSLYATIRSIEDASSYFSIEGSRVVIQGFGNVGSHIAQKLHKEGALIVGASDITTALYDPDGLNLEALLSARASGGLIHYTPPCPTRFDVDQLDWLLEAPCDVLIPCARPDAITARNADRIQCQMIVQGANAPSNRLTEYYLQNRRGITSYSDFIVNVGGVIGCAVELEMTVDPVYRARVKKNGDNGRGYVENLIYNTVTQNVKEVLDGLSRAQDTDLTFREEALRLATLRLEQKETCWL